MTLTSTLVSPSQVVVGPAQSRTLPLADCAEQVTSPPKTLGKSAAAEAGESRAAARTAAARQARAIDPRPVSVAGIDSCFLCAMIGDATHF